MPALVIRFVPALGMTVAAVVLAFAAFALAGWLAVGLLGLFICSVAVHLELERDGPTGMASDPGLFAASLGDRFRGSRADRAARHADVDALLRLTRVAKVLGVVTAAAALGGFVWW